MFGLQRSEDRGRGVGFGAAGRDACVGEPLLIKSVCLFQIFL